MEFHIDKDLESENVMVLSKLSVLCSVELDKTLLNLEKSYQILWEQ